MGLKNGMHAECGIGTAAVSKGWRIAGDCGYKKRIASATTCRE